jgi:hypothetical protein
MKNKAGVMLPVDMAQTLRQLSILTLMTLEKHGTKHPNMKHWVTEGIMDLI